MISIANKYNSTLLVAMAFAPIAGFIFISFINVDLFTAMQALSYIGVILLLINRIKSKPLRFPIYLFFYLLFVVYIFFSTFYLYNKDFELKYLWSNRLLGGLSFLFIIENVRISTKQYLIIIKTSIAVLIFAVFIIIIQESFNPQFFVNPNISRLELLEQDNTNENRLFSIYSWIGELTSVGYDFVPIFLLVVEYFIRKKKYILIWILAGLIFAFLTKARWIMVNTILVFFLVYYYKKENRIELLRYFIMLPLVILLFFQVMGSIGFDMKGIVNDRILEKDKGSMDQRSAGTRILAFEVFNKVFWDKPFLGNGEHKYGMGATGKHNYKLRSLLQDKSAQIHVGYLSLFYSYGLLGGSLFMIFLFLFLKKLFLDAQLSGIWSPFLGFTGFALANLTMVTFSYYEMGFIIIFTVNHFFCQRFNQEALHA